MSERPHIPHEYRKAGITTPEEAAQYAADIIGVVSVERTRDSIVRTENEGHTGEAAFYRAVLRVLLRRYAPENG